MAGDVFNYDDGIIDYKSSGDRERHQRQIVECVPGEVHDAECADQRERHGDAGDHCGPSAAQKQEHDQDD